MNTLLRLACCLLLAATILAAGCKRGPEKKRLELDPKFSVNVMPVPGFWPREKLDWPKEPMAADAQKAAYAKYGKPDYIRMVHTIDGRVVRPTELDPEFTLAGRLTEPRFEWIYYNDGIVLSFNGPKVTETKLNDMIRLLCLHGDPNEVKSGLPDSSGEVRWTYYYAGKEYRFQDGRLVGTLEFKALEGFNQRF